MALRNFPSAGPAYDRDNEAAFRREVERAIVSVGAPSPSGVESPTLTAGDNDDYAIGSDTLTMRVTPDATGSNLTGLIGGSEIRKLRVINLGTAALTITHEDTGSTAENRIVTPDAASWVLEATDVVDLEYDETTERWRLVEIASTSPTLASGTYTPTLTGVTNVSASSPDVCQYMRVGDVVTVSGSLSVTPTGAGDVELGISLPIASSIASATQCAGVGMSPFIPSEPVGIYGDGLNGRASMYWIAVDTTAQNRYFTFTYLIV